MRNKGKQKRNYVPMSKGPPKLSKDDEESQSMALFDSSIPSGKSSKKVHRVYDVEESDNRVSSDSDSDDSDNEPGAKEQLMAALGVQADQSSDEEDSAMSDAGTSEEDISGTSADESDELSDDTEDAERLEDAELGEAVSGEDSEEDGDIVGGNKRPASSSSEDISGTEEELSLADSSSEHSDGDSSSRPDQFDNSTTKNGKPKKKLKPLDYAVDPDDNLEPENTVKAKTVISEKIKPDDNFCTHFEHDMDGSNVATLGDKKQWVTERLELGSLGKAIHSHPPSGHKLELQPATSSLPSLGLRSRLFNLVGKTLKQQCNVKQIGDTEPTLSAAQRSMFDIINQYKDLYNPTLTFDKLEEHRMVYCLHSLNHILKTRLRVTLNSEEKHSTDLKKQASDKEYRDQGLTRPKVLILTPFKECARRIVNMFESLLMTKKKSFITNKKRFTEEFSPEEESAINPKKPDDYLKTFEGNLDDCFRLGVQLSKSGMKLYADFYKADILLCSPLGLRLILGAEGDLKRDYDFMSSIEVLILDQADVFLMQNWDHVLHAMRLLHVQPKQSHDTDYSRVRMWTLDGHAKHYRQTIIQSSIHSPDIAAILSKYCSNRSGEVKIQPTQSTGSICHIVSQMPLLFQKFPSAGPGTLPNDRFTYFTKEVLPQYTGKERAGTLIYVPSYYDYVRLRNYLHKGKYETSLVCEYSSDKAIRRAKKKFYTKETHFMLYTERVHFFRRMQLRKIKHLIFYSLPTYPQFFAELCNMYKTTQQADASCLVLFADSEAYKLAPCVGIQRTQHMVSTEKNVFMFVTGDE